MYRKLIKTIKKPVVLFSLWEIINEENKEINITGDQVQLIKVNISKYSF